MYMSFGLPLLHLHEFFSKYNIFGDVRYPRIPCRLPLYLQVAEVCIHRNCMGGAWAYVKLKMPTLIYFEQSTKCNSQQYLQLYRSTTYHHPQIQPQLHCQCSPASTLALHWYQDRMNHLSGLYSAGVEWDGMEWSGNSKITGQLDSKHSCLRS